MGPIFTVYYHKPHTHTHTYINQQKPAQPLYMSQGQSWLILCRGVSSSFYVTCPIPSPFYVTVEFMPTASHCTFICYRFNLKCILTRNLWTWFLLFHSQLASSLNSNLLYCNIPLNHKTPVFLWLNPLLVFLISENYPVQKYVSRPCKIPRLPTVISIAQPLILAYAHKKIPIKRFPFYRVPFLRMLITLFFILIQQANSSSICG